VAAGGGLAGGFVFNLNLQPLGPPSCDLINEYELYKNDAISFQKLLIILHIRYNFYQKT
jgi:hypothetical protein